MALVLSGGSGERLSVLSAERAVSAVPFGGKYRVIDFVLSNCCHSGIQRVGVLTQHLPTSLHDHIGSGRPWDLDRRDGGVLILQPFMTREHAGWYRGTADAVTQNWDTVVDARVARVLVLSGDHVYKMDYRMLFQAHEQSGAAVTMAITPVPAEQTHRFGMVTLDGEGRVVDLEEKPERTASRLASMGIYLFESEVLGEALRGHPVDLVDDVLRPLIRGGVRIGAFEYDGYWEDIGTLPTYYRANLELVAPEPRLRLDDPRWPILTRDEERPPVLLMPGADVESSLVANGCRVAGRVRRSILFPGVTVERDAVVSDSVLLPDVLVGHGARLDCAILDKFARVGGGAWIGCADPAGESDPAFPAEVTLIGKYSVIPDGGRVGRQVVLGVGAGPQDFVDNEVRSSTRVPDRIALAHLP
jgi:glucose-1-phosphate adenylyltransferase